MKSADIMRNYAPKSIATDIFPSSIAMDGPLICVAGGGEEPARTTDRGRCRLGVPAELYGVNWLDGGDMGGDIDEFEKPGGAPYMEV